MTLINDITELTDEEVAQQAALIQRVLLDTYGNADFSKGTALYDLVIRPAATYHAMDIKNADRIRRSSSLLEISQDPTLADDDTVDNVLSNFNIVRKEGNKAGGSVTIVLDNNNTTPIPENSVFSVGTLVYRTQSSFIGVPDASLISQATDRLIKAVDGGLFEFTIEVEAENEGSEYQLIQNTAVAMQNPPSNYIRSFTTFDFTAGAQAETNEELIERLKFGVAGKTISTRLNIGALIKDQFSDVRNLSVVGYQDPDMRRDAHNIERKGHGGKSDIYVQPGERPRIIQRTVTATLRDPVTKTWQMYIGRDVLPGFYSVERIIAPEFAATVTGTNTIITRVPSINDTTGDLEFIPELEEVSESSFTRFHELTVEFTDTLTDVSEMSVNDTKEYLVDFLAFEGIADIQAYVSDRTNRAHRYDDLVRYPIPVIVSTTFAVRVKPGSSVNIAAIQSAVATRINALGFCNQLSASVIIDEVQDIIPSNAGIVMPIDMVGRLILPDGANTRVIRSSTLLDTGVDHDQSISDDTVMFFCNPRNVSVEVIVE